MNKFFKDKRIVVIYIVVIIIIIIGITYALSSSDITANSIYMGIDEDRYGSTTFDSSNLNLIPILDDNYSADSNSDNVIHISFYVGGDSNNDTSYDIIYDIALVDLEVDCDLISYLKWKLIKNDTDVFEGTLNYDFDTIVDGRLVLTDIQQDLVDYNKSGTGYDHYDFYLWISDNCQSSSLSDCSDYSSQDSLLGISLSGAIEVELYGGSKKALTRSPSSELDTSTCINGGA